MGPYACAAESSGVWLVKSIASECVASQHMVLGIEVLKERVGRYDPFVRDGRKGSP